MAPGCAEAHVFGLRLFQCADCLVIEDVDPERGPMDAYGTWFYDLPPMSDFMMRHPLLRWLFGENPEIRVRMNAEGTRLAREERSKDLAPTMQGVRIH